MAQSSSAKSAPQKSSGRPAGLITWISVGAVIAIVAVLVIVKVSKGGNTQNDASWSAADATVVQQITNVPASVFDTVGVTSPVATVTAPTLHLSEPQLVWKDSSGASHPGVLYYGGEYCPYCAAQRWPTIIALSRFGTWSGLGNTSSYSGDVYPNTQSFTFYKAHFKSKYITVQTVEIARNVLNAQGTGYAPLQKATKEQDAILTKYDNMNYFPDMTQSQAGSIPFISVGNRIMWAGSSFPPSVLQGQQRADIAANLTDTANPITQGIIASANYLTAAICSQTQQQPSNVCSSKGVQAAAKAAKL